MIILLCAIIKVELKKNNRNLNGNWNKFKLNKTNIKIRNNLKF